MPAGTLEVFLIGAVGIKDTEVFGRISVGRGISAELVKQGGALVVKGIGRLINYGKADPYAVIICGKRKLRSNTASNQGSKPVWNQKFSIYIDDSVSELLIKIYNHNILTEDDEIGSTVIPLTKVFAEGKHTTTSYNVVRPSGRVKGEVKLSVAFNPKFKPGQESPSNSLHDLPGPYNNMQHGSPYTPPEPKVKHDPLTGPHGYFRSNSSVSSDSDGSSRLYPSSTPNVYPPVPPVNEPQYPQTESSASYTSSDDLHSRHQQERLHGVPSTSDYGGSSYQHSPYAQFPHPQGPPCTSQSSHHGAVPISSASSPYTQHGDHNSYSSIPSTKPYGGYDDLAVNFGALNVSGSNSECGSHESYSGYHRPQLSSEPCKTEYPRTDSSHHGNYPGYNPPPNTTDNISIGYPPLRYPPVSYPSQFESGSGKYSHSGSVSHGGSLPTQYGYQAPPSSSYYPPQSHGLGEAGNPPPPNAYPPPANAYPPPANTYPPVHLGYPNAPPYIPAGYPKQGLR